MATTFLRAKWLNIIMANYAVDPAVLVPYLPNGVTLDTYEGKTYVSLVGFLFKDTSIFNIPITLLGTFEEINLRFYVTRKVGNESRKGVVFINETVPNEIVAKVANKLYKEHYTAVPTKHSWIKKEHELEITYQLKFNEIWNSIKVKALKENFSMQKGSIEEFIYDHYYGYTKVDATQSIEYKINHPSWKIHPIVGFDIDFNFSEFYGNNFKMLDDAKPQSVMLASGSEISVDWKRFQF
eukprot:gene229-414_t